MGQDTRPPRGWYGSLIRPLFFALSPERAHRLALRLLALPLPWERFGGAVDDPTLRLDVSGLELRNPVGLAAGFDKSGERVDALARLGFGYVVCGTFTRRPRRGNAAPRIARSPGREAMTNAMGLPNPGADAAAAFLRARPRVGRRLASIADEDLADVLETHAVLEPLVDATELNASCPNVAWGRDRDNEAHLRALLRELTRRRTRPMLVKLPPFRTGVEREVVLALARLSRDAGVDGITCSNTLAVADPRLAVGSGGLSGRPLLEGTVENVRAVRGATEGEVPIHASGGVFTASDALACIRAGASTVQVYTAMVFRGPGIVGELTAGLAEALRDERDDVASLVGTG